VLGPVVDARGRPLQDLRLSVTDRCNLRCAYCMPEEDYVGLPRADVLDVDELTRLVEAFVAAGVSKVRLTGGEPLLRRDLPDLVARIAALDGITDLALTTNGTLLGDAASALRAAGLHRVSVSLDTLRPERHHQLTRRDNHGAVLAGIAAAGDAGFTGTKINAVVVRGVNDDEVADLLRFGAAHRAEVRFIEYMDVDGATGWDPRHVVTRSEVLDLITERLGPVRPLPAPPSAPARRYRLGDGTSFGIVASTSAPFCATCDRSRVTADGRWYRCLYATHGDDLRGALRRGATGGELRDRIVAGWSGRRDQGAVDRLALGDARAATPVEVTRRDPHREMHTRGG
jgi:cyclic pyranopterin phosphate synthase